MGETPKLFKERFKRIDLSMRDADGLIFQTAKLSCLLLVSLTKPKTTKTPTSY
jgi:hypothetical protein